MPEIQSTELTTVNKLKFPSEDTSVPFGTKKKAITSEKGGRILEGKVDRAGKGRREGRGQPDLA